MSFKSIGNHQTYRYKLSLSTYVEVSNQVHGLRPNILEHRHIKIINQMQNHQNILNQSNFLVRLSVSTIAEAPQSN